MLATLLLAAHFLRYWALGLVSLCLLLPFLLLVRRPWAARLYQAVLSLGALLWLGLALGMARDRRAQGLPSARLLVILLGVALFTAVAAGLFELPSLRRRYGLRTGDFFRSAPAPRPQEETRSGRGPRTTEGSSKGRGPRGQRPELVRHLL